MSTRFHGLVAALDCGTNSTRLLVLDGEGRTLTRRMQVTRLGQGVDATHRLSPQAIAQTVAVLADMRSTMDTLGVTKGRLVATSAVRDAVNGDTFLQAASDATGISAELLSGDEEGRLAYAGATSDLAPGSGDDVVIDIGGGSTELVVAREGSVLAVSLDLGCVRLSERYLAHDPPHADEQTAAEAVVHSELDRAFRALPVLGSPREPRRLIGLAGTVSTLAALDQKLDHYDRDRIHHYTLRSAAVRQWYATLAAEPASARATRVGMDPGRHDVILGGVLVLRVAMERLGVDTCLVSEADILDGIALGLLGIG